MDLTGMNKPYQKTADGETSIEPRNLKFLRLLVTTLLIVLIFGFLVIVGVIVKGIRSTNAPTVTLPIEGSALNLPADTTVETLGAGNGHIFAIVKTSSGVESMLIYDSKTLTLQRTVPVNREALE
jgi:hypothetical protein